MLVLRLQHKPGGTKFGRISPGNYVAPDFASVSTRKHPLLWKEVGAHTRHKLNPTFDDVEVQGVDGFRDEVATETAHQARSFLFFGVTFNTQTLTDSQSAGKSRGLLALILENRLVHFLCSAFVVALAPWRAGTSALAGVLERAHWRACWN
jgi:hypothetical protein